MTASRNASRLPWIRGPRGLLLAALVASTLMAGGNLAKRAPVFQLVSVAPDGTAGDRGSLGPSASFNGRLVAFSSQATDLIDQDTQGQEGHYVLDRKTGQMRLVSLVPENLNGLGTLCEISGNGRFVTFQAEDLDTVEGDTNGAMDVFLHDLKKGTTERLSVLPDGSQGFGFAFGPSISKSGRFVAFVSESPLTDDDTNQRMDCFVYDRRKDALTRITDGLTINAFPRISAGGRFVTLVTRESLTTDDTNEEIDIYLHDRRKGTTERVSLGNDGAQADRRCVDGAVSSNGRFVVFASESALLVEGDDNQTSDVFIRDRKRGTTRRVSVSTDGSQADGESSQPRISANGRFITFTSRASNLADDDTNGREDVFLHDRKTCVTVCLSVDEDGVPVGDSFGAAPTNAARLVTFASAVPLAEGDDSASFESNVYLAQPGKGRR